MQVQTRERGPIAKVFGAIAAIAVVALAATLGIVVLAVALGLALIGAVVVAVRLWWLRRQFRAAGFGGEPGTGGGQSREDASRGGRGRQHRPSGVIIEGEYERSPPEARPRDSADERERP